MANPVKNAQQNAQRNAQHLASMAAKDERARDAALAMKDYVNEIDAMRDRTAKLRALRLARDAEELKNPKPKTTTKTPAVKGAAKDKAPPVRMAKPRST